MKLRAGKYMVPVEREDKNGRIYFSFAYNKTLMAEIKCMEGAKWHGFDEENPSKRWSVSYSARNLFQLAYLEGKNPYYNYEREYIAFKPKRNILMAHQIDMVRHGLTVHFGIWAAEMGTGKTLAAIELIEAAGIKSCFWVGPKNALRAVQREFFKWKCPIEPQFYTYDSLKKVVSQWPEGLTAPQLIIFDESQKLKTPTAQRSIAAKHLADGVRRDWGKDGYVIELSGSPAPKSPVDWWHQCEVACPGFIKEGNISKFKERLALIKMEESLAGSTYPKIITWKDSDKKCNICGKDQLLHNEEIVDHIFEPMVNEIELLYRRMHGLVLTKFKKDCMDLPEKVYRTINCPPTQATINAARIVAVTASRAIEKLTRLRELSDGFQYQTEIVSRTPCLNCIGTDCTTCDGSGEIKELRVNTITVPCPKDEAVIELLEEHEDYGRIVIYAGFTASVDRIENLCYKQGWQTIRVDGRGWKSSLAGDPLDNFQDKLAEYEKIAFIGHPGSAGIGLTLTASPTIIYYSNDFNAEYRIQSEDRIHRPGCKGANIIDLIHLPTDELVLDNLKKKRELQSISLGELSAALEKGHARD